MRINIVRIVPPSYIHYRCFDEIVGCIEAICKKEKMQYGTSVNTFRNNWTNIVIGAHLWHDEGLKSIPEYAIIFNTEQIGCSLRFMRRTYTDALLCHKVLDYSLKNIDNLKVFNPDIDIKYVRIGYDDSLVKIKGKTEETIDVLFYGSIKERRQQVLDKLKAEGLIVSTIFGLYGKERDAIIADSKIILNIHAHENQILESVRLSYLMANRKAIVSECEYTTEIYPEYKDGLSLGPVENITERCNNLLFNKVERAFLEEEALTAIKQISFRDEFINALTN